MVYNIKSNYLDTKITEFVNAYFHQGYVLNTITMNGSNGTRHIDMRKNHDFIRIWIEKETAYHYNKNLAMDYNYHNYVFVLRLGHKTLKHTDADIVWNDDLEVFYEHVYYVIGNEYDGSAITDDIDTVKHWIDVSNSRINRKYEHYPIEYTDIDRLRIGLRIVKKMPKTKTIHLENILSVVPTHCNSGLEYTVRYETNKGVYKTVTIKAIRPIY